jgi:hypothetical protein
MTTKPEVGHCKADSTDVYIGRGPGGRDMTDTEVGNRGWLGNPYPVDECESRAASIEAFKADFIVKLRSNEEFREAVKELEGKTLGCWCQGIDDTIPACHGEVIAEFVERLNDE